MKKNFDIGGFSKKYEYMELPCAKCHQYKAIAIDWYENKNGSFIVKYNCTYCNHDGRRSSASKKRS